MTAWAVGPNGDAEPVGIPEHLFVEVLMRADPRLTRDDAFEVSAAYDILADDGYSPKMAAEMAIASWLEHRDGNTTKTAEQMARHIVKLRHALRGA